MRLVALLIMLVFTSITYAQQKIGAWQVVLDTPGIQIAKTINDSNSVAGIICFTLDNSCSAYISADIGCEENAKYPLMVNAKTGASTLNTTCLTLSKVQYLIIEEFSSAVAAFESGGEVGFAVPMQSGKFRVVRFDCTGATAAIRQARTLPPPTTSGTKNQTL